MSRKTHIKDRRFKCLSTDATLLYGLMLDRMTLSMKNGWLDAQNRAYIYYSMESIMEGLGKPDIIYVKNLPSGLLNEPYGSPCLGRVKITPPDR